MLAAGLFGLDEVVLTKGECAQCHFKKGEALLGKTLETFTALQSTLGLTEFKLCLEDKPKNKSRSEKLSRRAFMTRIVDDVKEKTGPDIKPVKTPELQQRDGTNTAQHGTRPSARRSQMQELLSGQVLQKLNETLKQSLPWGIMQVDEANCIGCGICVAVCPTGALIKEFDSNQLVRTYNSAICTSCDLCQEACPQQVIGFTEVSNLQELVVDNSRVVARIDLHSCLVCGETIPEKEGKICTTCQKRQLTPIFA